jgi:HAMP domain-containing protein
MVYRNIIYAIKAENIKNEAERFAENIDQKLSMKRSISDGVFDEHQIKISGKETVNEYIEHLINRLNISDVIFILDANGDIVATNSDDVQKKNYSNRNFFKEAMEGDIYISEPIGAKNYYVYYVPLQEKDWRLIYGVPTSTFSAQVPYLTRSYIFSTGTVFVIIIGVTLILSRGLLRPIRKLAYEANKVAMGYLDYPINNGLHDEVGKLIGSFEVMRNKLKDSHKELKDANTEAILILARACEVRDEDTGNHVLRIENYSMALAKELGFDDSFVKELGASSMLHDVGKIHVQDRILRKRGYFTIEEREEMKKHPLYGDKILGESHFFQMAREIARWHHENWDGTGYPDGLKGETIPISVRIVRLADVYDAMVTKRSYKVAWTDAIAFKSIVNHSGTYFDPRVVEAFCRLFEKGIIQEIKNKYVYT